MRHNCAVIVVGKGTALLRLEEHKKHREWGNRHQERALVISHFKSLKEMV